MMRAHPEESHWTATVRNKKGRVIRTVEYPMRSFLTQYYQLLYWFMGAQYGVSSPAITITDTSNNARAVQNDTFANQQTLCTQDASSDASYGIQVGTGNTANSGSTYQLATKIANGVNPGQLGYGSMGITLPSGTSPLSFTLTRTFTNSSGGNITITEVGLACQQHITAGAVDFLLVRDVLSSSVTVNNGNNVTFTLTLSYTIV